MKDAARAAKVNVRRAVSRIQEITVTRLLDLPQCIVTGYWPERAVHKKSCISTGCIGKR